MNPSTGDVRLVFAPDQAPLQLDSGDTRELPLLSMVSALLLLSILTALSVLSVLAVDLTEELGDNPLQRGATDAVRGAGRGAG